MPSKGRHITSQDGSGVVVHKKPHLPSEIIETLFFAENSHVFNL